MVIFHFKPEHIISITLSLSAMISCVDSIASEAPDKPSWKTNIGLGYDSNAFKTPDKSYIDYKPKIPEMITPLVQDGFFIPFSVGAMLLDGVRSSNGIRSRYTASGNIYLDSSLSNANDFKQKIFIGHNIIDKTNKRLYAQIDLSFNRETYFDRDTGLEKTTSKGKDISNKYNYISTGARLSYENKTSTLPYRLYGDFNKRNYSDPVVATQLDHSFLHLGIGSEYDINRSIRLKAGYTFSNRSYNDRHARDLSGDTTNTNPTLDYTSHDIDLSWRTKTNKAAVIHLDYNHRERIDNYLGYNDYDQNKIKIRGIYKTPDTRTKISYSWFTRNYPRAFAYDNPGQPQKEYNGTNANIKITFSRKKHSHWWSEANYHRQKSSDKRYQYSRYKVLLGIQKLF